MNYQQKPYLIPQPLQALNKYQEQVLYGTPEQAHAA